MMMKTKIFRNIFTLLLAFTMVFGLSAAAFAADEPSTVTFQVDQKGTDVVVFAPGSEWTDSDLFDSFKCVMPGDERTENITIHNKVPDCDYIKVWLKPVPHTGAQGDNSISPKVLAELTADERRGETPELDYMLDFLAQLSLTVQNMSEGEQVVFEASPAKTGGLAEGVYLGRIPAGETINLRAMLNVPIGLDNRYAGRIGEVDWVFTAECFNIPTPPPPVTKDVPLIKTGLLNWPIPVLGGLGIALLGCGLFVVTRKRKEEENA